MPKNKASQTDVNTVRKQNQQSQNPNQMSEEFGSETDVAQVQYQNQESQKKMKNASSNFTNQFGNGSK